MEKGGREGKERRKKGKGVKGLVMASLIFLHGSKHILFYHCLHSPADDGSGVDLDGLLALTSCE